MEKIIEPLPTTHGYKIPKQETETIKQICKQLASLEKKIDALHEELRHGVESINVKIKTIDNNFEVLFQDASSL
jgi:hypothetical protein